jgi:putative colanic acid biosynthesis glycosyltransferase
MAMLITIITVVKNNARGLRLTGRSIQVQQQVPVFEWIVIDAASTDQTLEVIAEFADLKPLFISESDHGPYQAMNRGIDMAKGEYVWFLNGGDCLSDAMTLRDVARGLVIGFKPDILYADAREDGQIMRAKPFHYLKRGPITHHQAMLYRRSTIGAARYDETYEIAADYAFTLDIIGQGQRNYYLERVICDIQGGGLAEHMAKQKRRENYAIRKHMLQVPDWKNKLIAVGDNMKALIRKR